MHELEEIFAEKRTENGDLAYSTTGSKLTDILFMSQYYRNHLGEVPFIIKEPRAKTFAMFIRDPRFGLGERDLGRQLLYMIQTTPEEVVACGRFDDLLYMDTIDTINYLTVEAKKGNQLAKKWMPRLNSKNRSLALMLCDLMGVSQQEYRKLIKVDTTESKLCANQVEQIEYEKVPSLAMLKYFQAFYRKDTARFEDYLNSVKKGTAKMNTTVNTCYDVYKQFKKGNKECDLLFSKLPQVNLGSILPIVDHSASMFDPADSVGKAISIGHYVAKNSTYLNNHIITFSSRPKLLELGKSYAEDMEILDSYHDCSNTDFGAVMELLGRLENDFPDWLLVLSDMEFDFGSSRSKDETMKIFREHNANTHIIWWNFNTRNTTSPEIDKYGNIYLSGYSPQLLNLLEVGFDQERFLNKLLDEYEEKCLRYYGIDLTGITYIFKALETKDKKDITYKDYINMLKENGESVESYTGAIKELITELEEHHKQYYKKYNENI